MTSDELMCSACGLGVHITLRTVWYSHVRVRCIASFKQRWPDCEVWCTICTRTIKPKEMAVTVTSWMYPEPEPAQWEQDYCGEGISAEFLQLQMEGKLPFKAHEILVKEAT